MPDKTPLNPKYYQKIEHSDYIVEKVTIETYPGFFLSGNIYRPKGEGPFPAILTSHSHFKYGRLNDDHIHPDILSAYEDGDLRKAATFGFADKEEYVKKYTRRAGGDDNIIIFRLAEVILSKAEAEAEMSYPNSVALDLLNQVRSRAGLKALTVADLPTITAFRKQIYNDRRLELVYEGHSWFDLVRTDRIGEVLGITDANKKIWPIPSVEILRNENLLPQNPGY